MNPLPQCWAEINT